MKKYVKFIIPIGILIAVIVTWGVKSVQNSKPKTVVLTNEDFKPKGEAVEAKDDNEVKLLPINTKKFDGYLLEIRNPLKVKVGFSKALGKGKEKTSEIAKRNSAVAAINGGAWKEGPLSPPAGILMSKGNIISEETNNKMPVMAISKVGVLQVGQFSLDQLKKLEVEEALTGNPVLVKDGKGLIEDDGRLGISSRSAIGQKKDGSILLLTIERGDVSKMGATVREVQDIMLEHGAINAINLDGGSSATMYYNGTVINKLNTDDGEREVVSIIYVEP